jgi:DNA-binding transcriptional MerR regulator
MLFMLYTAKQIADKLNRPPTTIRGWGEKYKEFIPREQKGRYFLYRERGLEVLRTIGELHDQRLGYDQVREILTREHGINQRGEVVGDNQTTGANSLVISQQFQATFQGLIKLFEEQKETNKLLKEQNEMLKQKLGLNEPTKAPRMNDKPKADKKPTPKPKMTTKQVKTNLAKAKTVKRKIKINPRGKNGRFTKKKKSFLARLFD